MSETDILLPAFAQAALTILVLIVVGITRRSSIKLQGRHINDTALAQARDWTEAAQKAANNYKNQFELPVLFYVATLIAYVTRTADERLVGLAWFFVASRVVHAIIHLGPNKVTLRGPAFLVGTIALVAIWVALGNRIFLTGA